MGKILTCGLSWKFWKMLEEKKKPGVVCDRFHMGEREGKIIVLGIFPIVGPRGDYSERWNAFYTDIIAYLNYFNYF